jgi:hypothetical protein
MGLPVAGPAFVAHLPRAHAVLRRQGAILLVLAPLRSKLPVALAENFIGRLSWDSSAKSGQLSRRRAVHPSTDMASKRPLPRDDDSSRFGDRAARLVRVFRPRGFAPPRRFPPLRGLQACCILLPIVRFAAFRSAASGASPEGSCVPAARFVPPEGCSPPVAVLRRRSRCPLAVRGAARCPPAHCWVASRGGERRLRGLAPPSGPAFGATIAGGDEPDPSWALFPFEVPLRDRSSALHHEVSTITRDRRTSSVPHPIATRDRGVPQSPGHRTGLASAGGEDRAPWGRSLGPLQRIGRRTVEVVLVDASLRRETRIGEANPCGRATESDPVGIPPGGSGPRRSKLRRRLAPGVYPEPRFASRFGLPRAARAPPWGF